MSINLVYLRLLDLTWKLTLAEMTVTLGLTFSPLTSVSSPVRGTIYPLQMLREEKTFPFILTRISFQDRYNLCYFGAYLLYKNFSWTKANLSYVYKARICLVSMEIDA